MMVSVIIPTYNAEKTLKQCVESVLSNEYPDFEVIVVDDVSSDQSREIVESIRHQRLNILVNKKNSGPGFTRNRGIRHAKGDLIILLDSDTYVGKTWIKEHVKAHKETSAHIVGGGLVGIHNTVSGKCDGFCNSCLSVPYSKSFYLRRFHLSTNNLSVKREVFKKIGYLIEGEKTGEDVVLCHRALKSGLKIYFKSDIIAYHHDRTGFGTFFIHQKMWGDHAIRTRKKMNMNFSFLLPNSYFLAHFYVLPLAFCFTAHLIYKWIRYDPSILLYSPILFISKLVQANAIKDSLKKEKLGSQMRKTDVGPSEEQESRKREM